MSHRIRRTAVLGLVGAAAVTAAALAGSGTAAATPVYIGPIYYEILPLGIFGGPSPCPAAQAADQAAGKIILLPCTYIPNTDSGYKLEPSALRVGLDVTGGS